MGGSSKRFNANRDISLSSLNGRKTMVHFNGLTNKKQDQQDEYQKEIIISTWLNEIDLNLKTYDIVRIMRHSEDYSCQSIHNEIFNLDPETEQLRCLMNPRLHNKTVTCLVP